MFDIQTENVEQAELAEWADVFTENHRFAWAYKEEHRQAIVRVTTLHGDIHCYVYDPARNTVVDATLDRFEGLRAGCWDGDEHPHVNDTTEEEEYDNYRAFIQKYAGPDSPFKF